MAGGDRLAPPLDGLAWGDHPRPRRHTSRVVAGFAAAVLVSYALFAVATRPPLDGVVEYGTVERLFAAVTFLGPPVAAAVSTARRGGLVAALSVGVVPAVAFGSFATLLELLGASNGDASAWGLALAFAAVGVAGAFAGYAVVGVGRRAVATWRA